ALGLVFLVDPLEEVLGRAIADVLVVGGVDLLLGEQHGAFLGREGERRAREVEDVPRLEAPIVIVAGRRAREMVVDGDPRHWALLGVVDRAGEARPDETRPCAPFGWKGRIFPNRRPVVKDTCRCVEAQRGRGMTGGPAGSSGG